MQSTNPAEKKAKSSITTEKTEVTKGNTNRTTSPKANPNSRSTCNTITLKERTGDIFTAASNTLILHACNCQGSWGGGIALAFKKHYPEAFKVYAKHCRNHGGDSRALLGTALLIPPAELSGTVSTNGGVGAPRIGGKAASTDSKKGEAKHFIGCLFTSNFYGKRRDSLSKILSATGSAMEDLLLQVTDWNASHVDGEKVGEVRMCKINSGLFAVPWEETVEVIEGMEVDGGEGAVREIEVVERQE